MFSLKIINALNDPDNPAKPKGLNVKLSVDEKACSNCGDKTGAHYSVCPNYRKIDPGKCDKKHTFGEDCNHNRT